MRRVPGRAAFAAAWSVALPVLLVACASAGTSPAASNPGASSFATPTTAPTPSATTPPTPTGDPAAIDVELSEQMALAREIVSLGRSARMGAKLKVRQPLKQVEVVLADATHRAWLEAHASLICDELNVKRVEFIEKAQQYITYTVLPDLKRLGPRLGKRLPTVRKLLGGK